MKKRTANILMVAVIALIITAGLLFTANLKGVFDKKDSEKAYLSDIRGIVTLARDGAAFKADNDTVLRKGDNISCEAGASVKIKLGTSYIVLGGNGECCVYNSAVSAFKMGLNNGEAFVNSNSPLTLTFEEQSVEFNNTVANLSVRSGAQSISVYYGSVENAKSGEMLEWINGKCELRAFDISSLNDFNITQIRAANKDKKLCFTNESLDKLESERWAQRLENSETAEQSHEVYEESEEISQTQTETSVPLETESLFEENDIPETKENIETEPPKEEAETESEKKPEPQKTLSCTLSIRCDTILDNWDKLDPAKAGYVPESGCIFPAITVKFAKGETVFDVLKRACENVDIPLEYSWTPMYDSYYVEGINNLYEFDCGYESGWMYKVNGWFPNYGCSSYILEGGESIVWCYTCVGLGEDLGRSGW